MKVLVACEYSGIVRDAFLARDHDAYSCDLLENDHPNHLQQDVLPLLKKSWDMVIAHPPCEHLAVSGNRWRKEKVEDGREQQAVDFFMAIVEANAPKVVVENPVGVMSTRFRKPDQIVHPWMFGDPYRKRTCLWLKGVGKLNPTKIVDPGEVVIHGGKRIPKWYSNRERARDMTFQGMAEAMAEQWGST